MSNAVQSMICFMPRVSLYDDLCPVFVAVQEPEIQLASDCRHTLPHQLGAWSSEVFLDSWICFTASLSYTFDFLSCR